jgi:hypothetical protein
MRKWKQFPTIVAKRRNAQTPDKYFTDFKQVLQSWMSIRPNSIKAYSWAITYAKRDLPKMNIIILLHHRAKVAVTACIAATLEAALEDNATLSIAATTDSKAFRSIVAQQICY